MASVKECAPKKQTFLNTSNNVTYVTKKTYVKIFILMPTALPSQLEVQQETNIGCQ